MSKGSDLNGFKTPGQLIEHLLEERGWTQRVLGIVLGIDETAVNKVIKGKQAVTAEMALTLGEVFAVEADQFLSLQKSYEMAQARIVAVPDPNRAKRAALFGDLPISEMIKRGWIDAYDVRDTKRVQAELIKFFNVKSLDEIEILPHAPKKTNYSEPPTGAQFVWINRVRQIASEMMVGRYTPFTGRSAIKKLSDLLHAPDEARKVPRILSESGIRFAIVETIGSAKIDGVCFWLDDHSPVIGMSLRYDRIDNFWFVLRHELEHVIQNHGRTVMVDAELEGERASASGSIPKEERIANEAASNFCVPKNELKKFINKKSPFFAERDILGFAATLQVHPGLIAGQLQHETTRYDRFRNHLVKIKHLVTPSAMVDGWGDVFPVEV